MILFDAHTHIYDCFDLDRFFDAAFENFRRNGGTFTRMAGCTCFLLLTESRGVHYFSRLQGMAAGGEQEVRTWSVKSTKENHSLWVAHTGYPDMRLAVVAGRQLITREGLELLALFSDEAFADGMALERAVLAVVDRGGVAVCPWGAGKWLGKRGRVLRECARQNRTEHFFLGDSGGRPSVWPRPRLLDQVVRGSKIISGSDPLPLPGEERRAGSFGGCLDGICSAETPAASLRGLLLDPAVEVTGYGRQLPVPAFVRSQVALRVGKRDAVNSL